MIYIWYSSSCLLSGFHLGGCEGAFSYEIDVYHSISKVVLSNNEKRKQKSHLSLNMAK